ncbi:hypothetical protein LQ954_03735 [Sphingomonas sp. IC-11]|uniref:hypothetical protein n=1 Tax=Sphingomonas sp. IC-11 TaxID=2898528 RepID=UPI001E45CC76|nr:hypothetical protein [Sphingomonas sp. IC-11]MCD2315255.1 hypothetical protein [Sphingomonas sp. IC-11]
MLVLRMAGALCVVVVAPSMPAAAAWTAANPDVAKAARDPRIAAALAAVNEIDRAAVQEDHRAFARLLADDLAVNNPQNGVSVRARLGSAAPPLGSVTCATIV